MAMTTSNSTRVKPRRGWRRQDCLQAKRCVTGRERHDRGFGPGRRLVHLPAHAYVLLIDHFPIRGSRAVTLIRPVEKIP